MRKVSIILLFLLVMSVLVSQPASAALINLTDYSYGASEMRLYQAYNILFGTTYITNDQVEPFENDSLIGSGVLEKGKYKVSLVGRYSAAAQSIGYYNDGNTNKLFDIFANMPPENHFYTTPLVANIDVGEPIGLWGEGKWVGGGSLGLWYSEMALNQNKYHFIFLNTPDQNIFLVGFEDLKCGDWDYNDTMFLMEKTCVPEPASVSLLGLGVLGLFGARLRRRMK